jgi:sodium transport system permease protein
MRWSNIKLIFFRELLDQLRDRRTLFMIMVLPIMLYPSIGIGMHYFIKMFADQPRKLVLVGMENLPAFPPLTDGENFVPQLFEVQEEAAQLTVIQAATRSAAEQMLEAGEAHVLLAVPPDLRERIVAGQDFRFELSYKSANEKSRIAYLRIKEALENWRRLVIRERLVAKGVEPDLANQSAVETQDIATPEEVSGGLLWGKLFPFLLVTMSLTGAFYPAVDLCAGEKERGTIETLLISPAARSEIVLGKYFTIWIFSIGTAVLNLLSMAATGWVVARQISSAMPVLTPPGLIDAGWILLLLVPLSAFFSALSIAIAAFARSTKEGHYYLTPLFIVTMPLVLVSLMPGVELNAFYSVVPITGAALLLKALIIGNYALALDFFIPVLLPTILYALLALRWAIDQFNREEVLFREAERLDLWLWARHLVRDKGQFPSAGESIFCYAIMLLLVWFLLFSGILSTVPGLDSGSQVALQRGIIILQVAFVAAPALIMATMLTSSARQTLLIRRPTLLFVALAGILALVLHPIIVEAGQHIHRGIPGQPKWVEEQLKQMLGAGQPLWWQLFLIALLPAVCEELAFRGFILSGLLRRMTPTTAIIVSGFLFGFFHVNPQQLLTATVLGWVLGLIATRSGSLLPGVLFHFVNNASAVLMSNFQDHVETVAHQGGQGGPVLRWFEALYRQPFSDVTMYHVPYRVSVLVICSLAATWLLTWLFKQPIRSPAVSDGSDVVDRNRPALGDRPVAQDTFNLDLPSTNLGALAPKTRDAPS